MQGRGPGATPRSGELRGRDGLKPGGRDPTNLHFSKSFFDKKYFQFKKRSSLAETTKVFKILALRGSGLGGIKCDMLLVI